MEQRAAGRNVRTVQFLAVFPRRLRRAGRGKRETAFTNQHQIANVNDRVRQIRQDPDRIAPEKKIDKHDDAPGDAPVPERNRNHAFALAFRCPPLHQKAHRKCRRPDQAEDDEIIPVQTENAMFPAEPCYGNKEWKVHI